MFFNIKLYFERKLDKWVRAKGYEKPQDTNWAKNFLWLHEETKYMKLLRDRFVPRGESYIIDDKVLVVDPDIGDLLDALRGK